MAKIDPITNGCVVVFGILNGQGQFWTPLTFISADAAREHISDFWGSDIESAQECLKTHKVVPVRVTVEAIEYEEIGKPIGKSQNVPE